MFVVCRVCKPSPELCFVLSEPHPGWLSEIPFSTRTRAFTLSCHTRSPGSPYVSVVSLPVHRVTRPPPEDHFLFWRVGLPRFLAHARNTDAVDPLLLIAYAVSGMDPREGRALSACTQR